MFEITKDKRDQIVNMIANSDMPAKAALFIIQTLNTLKPVESIPGVPDEKE